MLALALAVFAMPQISAAAATRTYSAPTSAPKVVAALQKRDDDDDESFASSLLSQYPDMISQLAGSGMF